MEEFVALVRFDVRLTLFFERRSEGDICRRYKHRRKCQTGEEEAKWKWQKDGGVKSGTGWRGSGKRHAEDIYMAKVASPTLPVMDPQCGLPWCPERGVHGELLCQPQSYSMRPSRVPASMARARMHLPKWRTKTPAANKANSLVHILPHPAAGGSGGVLNVVGCSGEG